MNFASDKMPLIFVTRNKHKFNESSKHRLMKNIEKKFQTTMIGSLACFEEMFGELWGHGTPREDLTPEELYWREKWDNARTEVLNNGNNQLRATTEEISEYTLTWNRHRTDFIVKRSRGEG